MDIGMIGLGRMGANMTQRLLDGGHRVVVTDLNADAVAASAARSAPSGAASLAGPRRQAARRGAPSG